MKPLSSLLLVAAASALSTAHAEDSVNPGGMALRLDRSNIELRLGAQRVTNGYGDWREGAIVGTHVRGDHALRGELASLRHFGESGTYAAVMDTITLTPAWYGSVALGAGDGAFYLPRYRADAFINRKFLPSRNLVGSLGVGYYRAPDGHIDRSVTLGGQYYFEAPWIVQAAVRFNESDPGSVRARQRMVALTYGREPGDTVVGRYSWGREAYLAIGPATSLVDFASREGSLQWRHWIDRSWGISVTAEHYRNPLYQRTGVLVGFFTVLQ
jgi:YaiO family outer membrane protein